MKSFRSFRSQWNIHHRILFWDDYRAAIKRYMRLEGKAALNVEEVVESFDGTCDVTKMWESLD